MALGLATSAFGFAATPARAQSVSLGDVTRDTNWILSSMAGDAIATNPKKKEILPYEGSYAAWGLALYSQETGDLSRVRGSWRWLYWFSRHMDPNFDYAVCQYAKASDGSWQPEPAGNGTDPCDTDSTDATAGVFMNAALAAWQVDPHRYANRLAGLHAAVANAVTTIDKTMDASTGLTQATPSYPVVYLMDNAEAYSGLLAGARIAKVLGDDTLRQHALDDAHKERDGMNTVLWNPTNQSYDWAKHLDNQMESVPCDWSILYPDAVEEAWAVAYGVPTDHATSEQLMNHFYYGGTGGHSDWKDPTAMDTYYDAAACPGTTCQQPVAYWPLVGIAFLKSGNAQEAALGAQSIHDAEVAAHRHKPFSVGWAGMLVRLELATLS